jgi:hypothetical protein
LRAADPLAKTIRGHPADKAVDMKRVSNLTEGDILTLALSNKKAAIVSTMDLPSRSHSQTGA